MEYKLTQFSHGAGCGCKISPAMLGEILGSTQAVQKEFPALLVGNHERDDAAVYDLGDGTALISTTDFFMPIVDDAATFGHIAAVNAISDVYAMGGKPLMAIAVLGWPVDKLPAYVAGKVLTGARAACTKAGIPLAGGHSIDSPEPIFGLAVSGRVPVVHLKRNRGARAGDLIYLTKPLGIGIYTTAQKKGLLQEEDHLSVCDMMMQLNNIGALLSEYPAVHAMTDVTGFGLAGHLLEMCIASDVSATISFSSLPLLGHAALMHYVQLGCVPGGTHRNFSSYRKQLLLRTDEHKHILCDPQTSGGLLLAVDPARKTQVEALLSENGLPDTPIGVFHSDEHMRIEVGD